MRVLEQQETELRKADRTVGAAVIYFLQYFVGHGLTSSGNVKATAENRSLLMVAYRVAFFWQFSFFLRFLNKVTLKTRCMK